MDDLTWIEDLPEDAPMHDPFEGYWALSDEIGKEVIDMVETFDNEVISNGLHGGWSKKYNYYYGKFEAGGTTAIERIGSSGEHLFMGMNHFRSIAKNIIELAIQTQPSFQVQSAVSDSTSFAVAKAAEKVLDHYMRSGVRNNLTRAVEHALIFDAGYVMVEYDHFKGPKTAADPITGQAIHEGDLRVTNPIAENVIFDPFAKSFDELNWIIVREWVNRYDLISRHLDDSELVAAIKSVSDEPPLNRQHLRYDRFSKHKLNNDVLIYKLFHKATEAVPDGRFVVTLADGTVLEDIPYLPYPRIPIEQIIADEEIDTPFGFSPLNSILSVQQGVNVLTSTIVTNQFACGTNVLAIPSGSDVDVSTLGKGIGLLYYDAHQGIPQPIQMVKTAPEIFSFKQQLEADMERLVGISSVARGVTKSGASGQGNALMASISAQNQGELAESYATLCSNVATLMIQVLRSSDRGNQKIAAITGDDGFYAGNDLEGVERVTAELGNPLSRTLQGKVQMAQDLLRAGAIGPDDYVSVLQNGTLDRSFEKYREQDWVARENELLLSGQSINVHPLDNHELHIATHKTLLFREEIRVPKTEADLVRAREIMDHIAMHDEAIARAQAMQMPPVPELPADQPQGNGSPTPAPDGGPGGAPSGPRNGAEQAMDDAGVSLPQPSSPPQI